MSYLLIADDNAQIARNYKRILTVSAKRESGIEERVEGDDHIVRLNEVGKAELGVDQVCAYINLTDGLAHLTEDVDGCALLITNSTQFVNQARDKGYQGEVIIASGYEECRAMQGLEEGAEPVNYLAKPHTQEALTGLVSTLILDGPFEL